MGGRSATDGVGRPRRGRATPTREPLGAGRSGWAAECALYPTRSGWHTGQAAIARPAIVSCSSRVPHRPHVSRP